MASRSACLTGRCPRARGGVLIVHGLMALFFGPRLFLVRFFAHVPLEGKSRQRETEADNSDSHQRSPSKPT